MATRPCRFSLYLLGAAVPFLFAACDNVGGTLNPIHDALHDPPQQNSASQIGEKNSVSTGLDSPPPNDTGAIVPQFAQTFLAAATGGKDLRLFFEAGPPSPFALFRNLPNQSTGRFVCQLTVAIGRTEGLRSGESSAGLRFIQSDFVPESRRRYVGALYDSSIGGLRAFVRDPFGSFLGSSLAFPGADEIDVRMEQTDTAFIFSCRATPADQSAGGWQVLHTEMLPPDPAPFQLAIGMQNIDEGGRFYFNHFAADGDAIAGKSEATVIRPLRDTVAAVRAAQAKLAAATPDLPGALIDLDAALAAHEASRKALYTAIVDYLLQRPPAGVAATKLLNSSTKGLTAARAAVATLDAKKAKAQLVALEKVNETHLACIGNLFGWKSKAIKKAPPDLFYLTMP